MYAMGSIIVVFRLPALYMAKIAPSSHQRENVNPVLRTGSRIGEEGCAIGVNLEARILALLPLRRRSLGIVFMGLHFLIQRACSAETPE
jgi:hypothetical protein